MSNELKDIVERLNRCYESDAGWIVESASKRSDGGWDLSIQPVATAPEAPQEATNDND